MGKRARAERSARSFTKTSGTPCCVRPPTAATATRRPASRGCCRHGRAGAPGRAFGGLPLNVHRPANRLQPAIHIPAGLRSTTSLPVEVTAEPDAIVTIAAVDEGILQLLAQKTPDPHAYFYRKLAGCDH